MDTQKEFLELLSVAQKDRDINWETKFLKTFPNAKVSLMSEVPQAGPDQFPYMFVQVNEKSTEPVMPLLKWISENGIGLAVNPTNSFPDFVFTYGMVWNFFRTGNFLENPTSQPHVHGPNCNHGKEAEQTIAPGVEFFVGSPSPSYLPQAVRNVLKEFLKHQGVMAPKIVMISKDKVNFDLCFSVESFGSPQQNEHEGILQALSWFLPAHYSLAFVNEQGIPSFEEL